MQYIYSFFSETKYKLVFARNKILISIVCVVFCAILGLKAQTIYADGWSLVGSSNATGTVSVAMPITDIQVSGGSTSSVPVKLRVTSGSLQMATTTGLTFSGSQTGSTIYFSGTRDNVNAALASLTYTRNATGTDTLEVSLVDSGEVFFPDNGHLYEYVSLNANWNTAKTAAEGRTKYGATGYLVTVGSQAENDFVAARLLNAGWMGASDSASEGVWRWVTGPESGTQFWSGLSGGSTVGGNYANWGTGEPNDSGGEDCAQFLTGGSGKWNDLPCSTYNLPGYVVEYGASGNLPTVTAKNVAITTVSAPTVSALSPTDNATNVGTSTNLVITFTQPVYAGTGSLAIWDYTNLLVHQPTTIDDANIISGLGTNIITINPATNFSENTDYYVIIDPNAFKNASNAFFTGITSTTTWSFRTGDFTAPTISSVVATSTASTSLTFTWQTNENSSSYVAYDPNPTQLRHVTAEIDTSPRVTSHSITVGGLEPCTWYRFQVYSKDVSSNTATSSMQEAYTIGCAGGTSIRSKSAVSANMVSAQEFTSSDGITLRMQAPANFTDASSTPVVQINSLLASGVLDALSKPSGYFGVGMEVFDIKILLNETDTVDTVDLPITIVFTYSDSDIAGMVENSLKIYHYHNNAWTQLNSCSVNTSANTVTCTTTQFSIFGLFGTPRIATTAVNGNGPSGITTIFGCRETRAKNYSNVVAHNQSMCVYDFETKASVSYSTTTKANTVTSTNVDNGKVNPNLYLGIKHADVIDLQKFLNAKGFTVASSGPGSLGFETNLFGRGTRSALIRFQKAHNIQPAIGFYGPVTRAKVEEVSKR
jgi:hypothetical protein